MSSQPKEEEGLQESEEEQELIESSKEKKKMKNLDKVVN